MFLRSIFLIGPMGAGKSTIGHLLAKKLEREFIDTDREIERRCGVTVAWVFDKEGEEGFRKRETRLLKELSQKQNMLIATGGGTVGLKENREIIKKSGTVVFLEASVKKQAERTYKDKKRPLLQSVPDREKVLKDLYDKRKKTYCVMADLTVNTDNGSPCEVINEIINYIKTIS